MLADSIIDSIRNSGPWLPAGIALMLFVWVFMRIKKQQQRRPQDSSSQATAAIPNPSRAPATPAETPAISARELRTVASELNALLVELHDTARQLAAQMDNRTSKLDALLSEADEKIKRLESLQSQITPDPPSLQAPPTPASNEDPKYRRIYDLADRGHTSREIAAQVGTHPGEVELILNLRAKPGS